MSSESCDCSCFVKVEMTTLFLVVRGEPIERER